jgi:amidase
MTELHALPATDIARLVAAHQLTASAVVEAALARLDAVNPELNAVVVPLHDEARAAAAAVDAAIARGEPPGLLAGVPVTVKINVDQAGHATSNGLVTMKDHRAVDDNPVVANLRQAGAVIIGRTNAPAFSLRWFTSNNLHGHTRNPWDARLTPGGSSGGAAAATAAGIGAIGHGTDIGGSVRYPAYACGIHGLRPTLGRVPAWNGALPERDIGGQLMAVSGPLARTVADLRLALAAMSAPDVRDPWYAPVPLTGPPVPRRVALCIRPEGLDVVPAVEAALRDAARRLQDAGYDVVELASLPPLREPARLQAQLWLANLPRGGLAAAQKEGESTALAVFDHMTRLTPQADLVAYQDALTARAGFLRQWMQFLDSWPLVLCPVSAELPFPDQLDASGFESFKRILEAQLTQVGLPLMGLPGLTVSTGLVGRTPVGVQLLAARYREDLLLEAGEAIEARGVPPTPVTPTAAHRIGA